MRALFLILLLVAACTVAPDALDEDARAQTESMAEKNIAEEGNMPEDSMTEEQVETMDSGTQEEEQTEGGIGSMPYSGEVLAGTTTKYLDFTLEDYENALAQGKVVILNFHATWCPNCAAEQPDIFAAFDGLSLENVVGFRVNYKDSNTDTFEEGLARQFGITVQGTKVFLKDGERILKDPQHWSAEKWVEEATKVG